MTDNIQAINPADERLMRELIGRVAVGPDRGRDISSEQAQQIMHAILHRRVDPVQIAVFFIALRMKRESPQEFAGLFAALQNSVDVTKIDIPQLVCLADPFDGYLRNLPVSPFIPAVLTECGMATLMTGVETVGPKHGVTAHKVLRLAGINPLCNADKAAANILRCGWAYLDQSVYAPKLFALNDLRGRIVKRTALTTLERLLLPLQANQSTHLVLGYVHKAYPEIYAALAKQAGFATALLTKGVEGGFVPALNKPIRQFFLEFNGVKDTEKHKKLFELPGNLAASQAAQSNTLDADRAVHSCLEQGLEALQGKAGMARNAISLSAAQILFAHAKADSFNAAVEKVQNCLDNGSAQARFRSLVESDK